MREICSKLTKTPEPRQCRRSGVFIVNLKTALTNCFGVSIVEQVNAGWEWSFWYQYILLSGYFTILLRPFSFKYRKKFHVLAQETYSPRDSFKIIAFYCNNFKMTANSSFNKYSYRIIHPFFFWREYGSASPQEK